MSVLAAALRRRHRTDGRFRGYLLCRRRGSWLVHLLGGTVEIAVVAVDDGTDGIAEVAQQMPAIRHLDRLRRALAYSVGVGASTFTRDDLYPGMLTKPFRERLSLTVWQQVHDLVALEVDEDSAVAAPSSPPLRWLSNGYAAGTFTSFAQSSTPRTFGVDGGVSGMTGLVAIRSNVSGLVGMASRSVSLEAASPPRANAT